MSQLIECVPNFSEGFDVAVIKQITDAIEAVDGVTLLDVDPGVDTNRTVVTFVGAPEPVIEAAVRAAANAKELIDMRTHTGAHPRFGAMDVCPLVPVANITMDEVVSWAHRLAERLGMEVGISGFLYEYAAKIPERRNLATCRAGEYEALPERLSDPAWKTDFGPGTFDPAYGVTAVGARDFLVAYNVNLNTTSTRHANAIAFDVREKGRVKTIDGTAILDKRGNKIWQPGSLKCVKGIGWFIEEYGIAQISMNLTNISVTPVHVAFDECCERARARGMRVTGSEIVGLVPLASMLEAGKYFLRKQQRSLGVPDAELIKIALKSMGLDELKAFNPQEKIIEYAVASRSSAKRLLDKTLEAFVYETASESPTPGGGSISAVMGSLAAALATMVANLSAHKRGWDDRWEEFSDWAEKGKALHDEILSLVDADADAFKKVMQAFSLPKDSEADHAARHQAIQEATKGAIEVPLRIMQRSLDCFEVIRAMADSGLPASLSDVGVAALAARAGVMGAFLNVKVNVKDLDDHAWIDQKLAEGQRLQDAAIAAEKTVFEIIGDKI